MVGCRDCHFEENRRGEPALGEKRTVTPSVSLTWITLLFTILFCFALPGRLVASRATDLFSFSAGAFDVFRPRHRTCEYSFEYQFQLKYQFFVVRPILGMMITAKGSAYGYGGFNFDFVFNEVLVLSPGIAVGFYHVGGGKNLGCPLEFRSCFEVAWQRVNLQRLGARISHISNASLGRRNPGQESIVVFYSIPVN